MSGLLIVFIGGILSNVKRKHLDVALSTQYEPHNFEIFDILKKLSRFLCVYF